jgi:hypothetical protein
MELDGAETRVGFILNKHICNERQYLFRDSGKIYASRNTEA